MNMTLSKRGDYVVRSAISLARAFEHGKPRKIREVVHETEVPQTFASQILADLVRAGVANSRAGRDGGYWLSRPPAQISVLEIVEAGEGPLKAERCALGEGPCRWEAVCPLHETWSAATAALREVLATTTLAELADLDRALESGTYETPADSHRLAPTSIAIEDVVHVELPARDAELRLAGLSSRLADILEESWRESLDAHRLSAAVTASLLPVSSGDPDGLGDRYLLGWRVPTEDADFLLEADLRILSLDAQRSEVRCSGSWKQLPASDSGRLAAESLGDLAQRGLRSFLRGLARDLETAQVPAPAPGVRRAKKA